MSVVIFPQSKLTLKDVEEKNIKVEKEGENVWLSTTIDGEEKQILVEVFHDDETDEDMIIEMTAYMGNAKMLDYLIELFGLEYMTEDELLYGKPDE